MTQDLTNGSATAAQQPDRTGTGIGTGTGTGIGTEAAVAAFNAAFDTRQLDQVAPLLTDDCVFDGTTPPDGDRHVGREAVLKAFGAVFDGAATGAFTTEEVVALGDRAVVRWRYDWVDHSGRPGHVRGVDLFRVRDGRVAEKLAYVKG